MPAPPVPLTPERKARQVLLSQGHAPSLLASLTPQETAGLVAMHGAADLPERFAAWLNEYREARKAAVDDEPEHPVVTSNLTPQKTAPPASPAAPQDEAESE